MTYSTRKLLSAIGLAIAAIAGSNALMAADTAVATSKKLINGREYSFEKLMTADGKVYQRILVVLCY